MKILFIGFWELHDPLTLSTTFPNLELLEQMDTVESILFTTVERKHGGQEPTFKLPFSSRKISYRPLMSREDQSLLRNKVDDFTRFPRIMAEWVRELGIDVILARGAMAGALAYLTSRRAGNVPFYVESFEPHADYMLDSGVWKSYDPRYLFQRWCESKEKKYAAGFMPVAENYRQRLIREGIPAERIATVPCPVNLPAFAYNAAAGQQVRARLGFAADAVVGVYLGKFGDIYYDDEAYELFWQTAQHFGPQFRLIVLTPNPEATVRAKLLKAGFQPEQFFVTKAPHHEVPGYLSAADFAFAPIKAAECRQYCSPVKVGEYWANGLPVLLTEGVGDDSNIIKKEGGGAIFDLTKPASIPQAIKQIAALIKEPDYRLATRRLAVRHRSMDLGRAAYEKFFSR
jgi:glycosyltransferase involved in cell wall biosynthesis